MGLIITTTLCALTGCAGKPQKTEMPHEETNLRSCCRIYTSTSCSCGLILSDDPEKTIVAATVHGTTDWGEGSRVVFYDGSEAFGQLFGADDKLDIVFLEIPKDEMNGTIPDSLVPVTGTDSEKEEVNITQIHAYDLFPENDNAGGYRRYEGLVESADRYMYDYDRNMLYGKIEKVNDGMSGMGVFDDEGKCLGIITDGNENGEFAGVFFKDIINLR